MKKFRHIIRLDPSTNLHFWICFRLSSTHTKSMEKKKKKKNQMKMETLENDNRI